MTSCLVIKIFILRIIFLKSDLKNMVVILDLTFIFEPFLQVINIDGFMDYN